LLGLWLGLLRSSPPPPYIYIIYIYALCVCVCLYTPLSHFLPPPFHSNTIINTPNHRYLPSYIFLTYMCVCVCYIYR
jgi:hypothetical protein